MKASASSKLNHRPSTCNRSSPTKLLTLGGRMQIRWWVDDNAALGRHILASRADRQACCIPASSLVPTVTFRCLLFQTTPRFQHRHDYYSKNSSESSTCTSILDLCNRRRNGASKKQRSRPGQHAKTYRSNYVCMPVHRRVDYDL